MGQEGKCESIKQAQRSAKAEEIRRVCREVRKNVVAMIGAAGSGHPGGSLSCVEIVSTLYFGVMRVKPEDPNWPDRDRFILSKGHAAPTLYAVLAEKGFFPKELLLTLRKFGSPLQGHPDARKTPGVEVSTGSLGQGLSMAVGMALAGKLDQKGYRVWVLLGDGECQEGQVWEAAMAASHYKLDNLAAFIDFNGLQIDGRVEEIMNPSPLADKWRAFGWRVLEVDGHDVDALLEAASYASESRGAPTAIIAKTVKGKGVSFMEGQREWHGKAPKGEELSRALEEVGRA